jgi:GNAT superfamily N-acetyltransferase
MDVVEICWLDALEPAPGDVAGVAAVLAAAVEADSPHRPARTVSSLTTLMRQGWDGDPVTFGVARDRGRVVAVAELDLPRWDNQHMGYLEVTVDPLRRREGLGRRLFEAGVDLVRGDGRTLVTTGGYDSPASVSFAKSLGLDRATEEVERRQELLTLDRRGLAEVEADAERASAGYDLNRLPAWTPGGQLTELARLTGAINDAPLDDLDMEDEVFTGPRIRAFELAQLAQGRRMYRLAARERASGALVGHTVVGVEGERPWYGEQYDTSVVPEHRGHRLGLRLKLAMLRWLAEREPQLRVLNTWNAASNDHMIAVNEVLGYRVVGRVVVWQRHL